MNVISLLKLVEEGWNMTTKMVKGKKYIYMNKNGNRVVFSERNQKNLCFADAKISESRLIANVVEWDDDTVILAPLEKTPTGTTSTPNIIEDDEDSVSQDIINDEETKNDLPAQSSPN